MELEKNGLGDFKWQICGCLIDGIEGSWYVLREAEQLWHMNLLRGVRNVGRFSFVAYESLGVQGKQRQGSELGKKHTLQKLFLTLMWHWITCIQGLTIEMFHFWHPEMSNSSHFTLKGKLGRETVWYSRWCAMLKGEVLTGFLLIEVSQLEPSSHL